jgi:hypothetical protein
MMDHRSATLSTRSQRLGRNFIARGLPQQLGNVHPKRDSKAVNIWSWSNLKGFVARC